jgi:myo-inositol-1(or 4)-monophosphatase
MESDDAQLAIAAAHAGARVLRELYGQPLARFAKSATDFATEADMAAEQAIMQLLREARPTDGFTGEETGRTGTASADRNWLVDPLCGTLNYAARTALVAVNVALDVRGRVTAAAAADPFSNEVFWTDGDGAYARRDDADESLVPSAASRIVDVNLDPPYPNEWFRAAHMLAADSFAESFRPRVLSTTLALAWVAAGRRAAYVTDGHLRDSVHFASATALCQAAGCVVTDLRGQPLHSGAGGLVAAADEPTHAELLAIIDQQLPG